MDNQGNMDYKTLFFVLLIVSSSYSLADEIAISVNPHDFDRKDYCSVCHGEIPMLHHDLITTCIRCHEGNIANHPVSHHPIFKRISYKITVPDWMPLSKEGNISCYTCHDYHNMSGFNKMLRMNYEMLCSACHTNK